LILTVNAVPLWAIIQFNLKTIVIMKKKMYEKPSMKVVLLKQRTMLLAGSGNGVDPLSPFAPGSDPLNP
jgi:hypothetical protein